MHNRNSLKFTVFTPTYNRVGTLPRVYESLRQQTVKDFEWLIIDDGSTDNTADLVRDWQTQENDFDIRYIYQNNQHKKVAHNRAVVEARGDFFIILDSDDSCIPDTIKVFMSCWQSIPAEHYTEFSAVWCLCQYPDGTIVGDRFPGEIFIDADILEIKFRYKIRGEKWHCHRTDVLKEYPFREDIPGLVPEGTVWEAIARKYKCRFVNEALRIYHQDVPGLIARAGEAPDAARSAPGAVYAKRLSLDNCLEYFFYAPKEFFMEAGRLTRFRLHCAPEVRSYVGYWPHTWPGKALVFAAAPLGLGMWLVDRLRQLRQRV